MSEPRDHHFVPQFFLRSFAVDEEQTKVTTLAKEGDVAVWMERSIKSIGYERYFNVHMERGRPVSVETAMVSRNNRAVVRCAEFFVGATDRSQEPFIKKHFGMEEHHTLIRGLAERNRGETNATGRIL